MSIYSIFRSTGISLSNIKGYGMIWYDHLAVAALNMRDFCWIRSFALTEATQRKQKLCLRANKRERREASQPSRSFARSKTRKRSSRRSGSFPRPTTIQQKKTYHFFAPTTKGTLCSPYFVDSKGELGWFGNKQTVRSNSSNS